MRERSSSKSKLAEVERRGDLRAPKRSPSPPKQTNERGMLLWIAVATAAALISGASILVLPSSQPSELGREVDREEVPAHNGAQLAPPPPHGGIPGEKAASAPPGHQGKVAGWSCYTLEAYSLKFIKTLHERHHYGLRLGGSRSSRYFFRCGTRITDLLTEWNRTKTEQCVTTEHGDTLFPELRVYLSSSQEERLHEQQKYNFAAQYVSLERLNDDYCDCLDGTDELKTNACSMSGVVAPLARKRWRQYLTSNDHVRLYDDEEKGSENKVEQLLTRVGGPVLPFRCQGDPEVLLAPSRVNDGVVDCCDGSDEVDEGRKKEWASRVERLEPLLDEKAGLASHLLAGNHSSVAQLLIRSWQTGLMACGRVKKERLRQAGALHTLAKRGHETWKERVANGWVKYGKDFVESRAAAQKEFNDTSALFQELRARLRQRMEEMGIDTPLALGASHPDIQRLEELGLTLNNLGMRLRQIQSVLDLGVLGDSFEYSVIASGLYAVQQQRIWNPIQGQPVPLLQLISEQGREDDDDHDIHSVYAMLRNSSLHVDNISLRGFSVAPFVRIDGWFPLLNGKYNTQPGSAQQNASDSKFGNATNQDRSTAPIVVGYWAPFPAVPLTTHMSSVNPSGSDGALWQRLFLANPVSLNGGFEQILRRRVRNKKTSPTPGGQRTHNRPSQPVVHLYNGGIPCGDAEAQGPMHSYGWLLFVCADADEVLEWHRNGKCEHQIVFGTPSACTEWTMEEATARLKREEASVRDYFSGSREKN